MTTKQNRFTDFWKNQRSNILLILGTVILGLTLNAFILRPYQVDGSSMEPTLSNGDRLIVSKIGVTWAKITGGDFVPKRGEIIIFDRGVAYNTELVKRVIGLPGERVVVKDGKITIYNSENPDGFEPDSAYNQDFDATDGDVDVLVGEDEVFVVGDNRSRNHSLDSRDPSIGNVPVKNIVGSLEARVLPAGDIRSF